MAYAPPAWYPDPTTRHELRYWNGGGWTEHVASAGRQQIDAVIAPPLPRGDAPAAGSQSEPGTDSESHRGRTRVLGGLGLLLCVLAVVALAVPGVGFLRATSDEGVRLDGGMQHLVFPSDRTYGVYVDDRDNSGYSESCSAVDEVSGSRIPMRSPGWSMSSSETEVLDLVFDTGSGRVSLSCSVPGEDVRVRPVPDFEAMLFGAAASAIIGAIGATMLIAWTAFRLARQPRTSATGRP